MLALGLCLLAAPLAHEGEPGLKDELVPPTHAAQMRRRLRRAGLAGMAVGGLWYLAIGDTLGAGDPASLIAGAGLVATTGALAGGAVAVLDPREPPMDWEASGPPLQLNWGLDGSNTYGERNPGGLGLEMAPRFVVADHMTLIAGMEFRSLLGSELQVDSRPQGDFDTALERWSWGLDVTPELRWYHEGFDLRLRPMVLTRQEATTYADGSGRQIRRQAIMPVTLGARFYLSGRQRFAVYVGPRWDRLTWTEGGEWADGDLRLGPLYGEAFYTLNLPHSELPGGLQGASRLRIGYEHSNFDGQGFDFGASIGFFGPVTLRYDMQLRRPNWKSGVQVGVQGTLNQGGGVALTLGWNAAPIGGQ